ncbi:dihydroneopterin aldolase [Aquibacillus koreensis]|uniref:7,8-dihydroneopterin aldolase n=1 Tax=Aquibacillus koreensis TaxID=279446 RepID=A0A9X3WM93_9BACI|nr:dihydroneopterin aldolase [Aquibacillus koreensis]MCT2535302.1 dihydroneopterin aldolase [Aquibacillus koreensis]MDC3422357.1 dihydroneopterin aldolase [Aquibacillus koreensis]
MDKIYLNQMQFYGYHGLFPEENKLGQRFNVDLVLELDLGKAGQSDDMDDSINYGTVFNVTKEVVEGKSRNLVEAVAHDIAERLFSSFDKLQACTVKVYKPDPPIPGHYQSIAIEIYRERP